MDLQDLYETSASDSAGVLLARCSSHCQGFFDCYSDFLLSSNPRRRLIPDVCRQYLPIASSVREKAASTDLEGVFLN